MRCAGAPAVTAGSPPGRRFSRVWWPPESRSTVDMPAGRVTELQGTEQQRREEKRVLGLCCGFLRQVVFVFFLSFFYLLPSQTRRSRCPPPCPRAAAGTPPHTAPCTRPSAAGSRSRTPSTCRRPAPSWKTPRPGLRSRTGPAFESVGRRRCFLKNLLS